MVEPKQGDMFWTDMTQAVERVQGSWVMYDGEPVFISRVYEDGGVVKCHIHPPGNEEGIQKRMDSPKFRRFRELPELGWMNSELKGKGLIAPVLLSRVVVTTRTHGLNNNNLQTLQLYFGNGNELPPHAANTGVYSIGSLQRDTGFTSMQAGKYPSLMSVLEKILPGTSLAYSLHYCITKDALGIRWLFRDAVRVGLFSNNDTLNLLPKHAYLREEIMSDSKFTLNNIREL